MILQELKWLGLAAHAVIKLTKKNLSNNCFYLVAFKYPYLLTQILDSNILCHNFIKWERYTLVKKGVQCWNCKLRGHTAEKCKLPLQENIKHKLAAFMQWELERKMASMAVKDVVKKPYLVSYPRFKLRKLKRSLSHS